jgi:hypothetical protein
MNTYDITTKDIKQLWSQLKASAKRRGIPFNLTPTDIDEIGIPVTCPILGMPLYFHKGKAKQDSISFDRIDSTKGYTKDNVIIISLRANQLKSNGSIEEIESISNFYKKLNENQ